MEKNKEIVPQDIYKIAIRSVLSEGLISLRKLLFVEDLLPNALSTLKSRKIENPCVGGSILPQATIILSP